MSQEAIKSAEAARAEKQERDLTKFLTVKAQEFKEKNPRASVEETAKFLVLERDKCIYGEKEEREEEFNSLKQDVLETTVGRIKDTKKGLFGIALESRSEFVPRSIADVIKKIYRDEESWDKAFSAASRAMEDLEVEKNEKFKMRSQQKS